MAIGELTMPAAEPPAILATPPAAPAMPHSDRQYRLTIDQYERMGRLGILNEQDPVILWKGAIVRKMTKNPPHSIALGELYDLLRPLVPEGYHPRQEQPIAVPDDGMPEPDLAVVRGARRVYSDRPPTTNDAALIVEVADSSLADDRGEILTIYAQRSIPVYWIVNLPGRLVEVHTEPTGPAAAPTYRTKRSYAPGEEVPVVLDGREVGRLAVAAVLP